MKKVAILLTISCVLIFILALTASVGIEFLPATDMRMWGIRSFAYQSLCWCCLVYPGIMIGFLLMRQWRSLFMALGLAIPLIAALLFESVSIGPSIRWVREKTAGATGIPSAELVCIGGRLSRESRVVFEVKDGISPKIIGKEVEQQDDTLWAIVIHTFSFVQVEVPVNSKIMIRKFYDEFNTILMVNIDGKSYAIFFGQSTM